ncbi:MAG: hypothetical protein RR308_12610, partial [Hafnia sp.]
FLLSLFSGQKIRRILFFCTQKAIVFVWVIRILSISACLADVITLLFKIKTKWHFTFSDTA